MARPEPFRALLEKALQADAPHVVARPRLVPPPAPLKPAPSTPPAASPALALDDEHKRTTLEQRLDAVVLAAGATPPHGMRPPKAAPSLVPLRLDRPAPRAIPAGDDRVRPQPRMLQFLLDDNNRPGGVADDSVSAIPRLEPVQDSSKLPVSVGIHTNVYRLGSVVDEETPSRPLPILGEEDIETRKLKRVEKVLTLKTLDQHDVRLSSFSSSDTDSDIVEIVNEMRSDLERANHAAAALALPVLSEEESPDFGDADLGGDLDELARQLGLEGMVPRTTPPTRADDSLDGDALLREPLPSLADIDADIGADTDHELDADDVELVAVATPTNPMRAMVVVRPVIPVSALDALEEDGDDDGFTAVPTPPSGTQRLPSSLLDGIDAAAAAALDAIDSAGFDDDNTATPAHGTMRPSLEAPSAVRFIVADAPARPRKAALTSTELDRNRSRAHDLYLIALDDIACRDAGSAIVHLELALAYDDETALYHDLLAQLQRKLRSAMVETEH